MPQELRARFVPHNADEALFKEVPGFRRVVVLEGAERGRPVAIAPFTCLHDVEMPCWYVPRVATLPTRVRDLKSAEKVLHAAGGVPLAEAATNFFGLIASVPWGRLSTPEAQDLFEDLTGFYQRFVGPDHTSWTEQSGWVNVPPERLYDDVEPPLAGESDDDSVNRE